MGRELPNQGEDKAEINLANPPTDLEEKGVSASIASKEEDSSANKQDEPMPLDESSDEKPRSKHSKTHQESATLYQKHKKGPQNEKSFESEDQPEEPTAEAIDTPRFCAKCGSSLDENAAFCTKCGTPTDKAKNKEQAIEPVKAEQKASSEKIKEKISFVKSLGTKKIGAIAVVAIVVIAALIVVPPLFRSPDELFAAGEYKAAYEKSSEDAKPEMLGKIIEKGKYDIAYSLAASDEDKRKVLLGACSAGKFEDALQLAETTEQKDMISFVNGIAYVFKTDALDDMKDSDSFVLKKAWYGGKEKGIALQVQGSNSYGQPVQAYYYFEYSSSKGRYKYSNSVSTLSDETIYKYADDWDEKLEKILNNATRSSLRKVMVDSYAIQSDVVDAVNNLFSATKFEDISLAPDLSIEEFGALSSGEGTA